MVETVLAFQVNNFHIQLTRLSPTTCHLQGTEDELMITAESVADGERQGTLDILWRIFIDLQVKDVCADALR